MASKFMTYESLDQGRLALTVPQLNHSRRGAIPAAKSLVRAPVGAR